MRQTMLGLLALMSAMLISLNMQNFSLTSKGQVIDIELETIAGGIGLEVLDYIGSKPFDAATIADTVLIASNLSPTPFPSGMLYHNAIDIDDFNEIQTHTISEYDFDFSVDVQVQYVDMDDPEQVSSTQTFAKRVEVTVSHERLNHPVTLSHVFSYP